MSTKKDQRVGLCYAPFVLPDDQKFEGVLSHVRDLLQTVRAFHGERWDALYSRKELKALSRDESILEQIAIARSVSPAAKMRARIGAKLNRNMWVLGREAVHRNDEYAARQLVGAATAAVEILSIAKMKNPELFEPILRQSSIWPVMMGVGSGWAEAAQQELAGLGEDLLQADGFTAAAVEKWQQTPARKWAYAIKKVLDWNRTLVFAFCRDWPKLEQYLRKKSGCKYLYTPDWFWKCAELPDFSKKTVPEWMALGKVMLKDQAPDFDRANEWQNWDRRAESRTKPGNSSRSKKRNDIFTSIQSAMETISADDGLPE